jgi:hypothetical protein
MSGSGAMIREILADLLANPGLALLGALVLLCLIMIIPVIAALRRKARERERERERAARRRPQRRALEPREPRFGPAVPYLDDDDNDDDEDDEDDRYRRAGFGSGPPRRGKAVPVGALAKIAWFGLGVAAGAGFMAVNDSSFNIGDLFRMPIGAGPEETAEGTPAAVTARKDPAKAEKASTPRNAPKAEEDPVRIAEEALAKSQTDSPPRGEAVSEPVDAQVAGFVSGMRARLPMPIGTEINLVDVNAKERVVTLAFAIGLAIPEDEYPTLQKTLEGRFRAGICKGKDELRIRALNDVGVSFRVVYADLVGKTVAQLEMKPNYCKETG